MKQIAAGGARNGRRDRGRRFLRLGILHGQHQLERAGRMDRARRALRPALRVHRPGSADGRAAARWAWARSASTTTRCAPSTATGSARLTTRSTTPGACRPRCRSSTSSTRHIHNHHGAQIPETWNFTEVGDARVLGRRQWHAENAGAQRLDFFGLNFGLKLPTGKTDVRNGGRRARGAHAAAGHRHHRPAAGRLLQPRARLRLFLVRRPAGPDAAQRARQLQARHAHLGRPRLPHGTSATSSA